MICRHFWDPNADLLRALCVWLKFLLFTQIFVGHTLHELKVGLAPIAGLAVWTSIGSRGSVLVLACLEEVHALWQTAFTVLAIGVVALAVLSELHHIVYIYFI
jgi:hypothetical protein